MKRRVASRTLELGPCCPLYTTTEPEEEKEEKENTRGVKFRISVEALWKRTTTTAVVLQLQPLLHTTTFQINKGEHRRLWSMDFRL